MRLAFVKYCGMASGGGERYLQSYAIICAKAGHDVTFYYTNRAANTPNHPDHDASRLELVKSYGIKTVFVQVDHCEREYWISDFDSKFDDSYDFVHSVVGGAIEYPFTKIKSPIIHTIHGVNAHNQDNIHRNILLCNWQASRWLANGGAGKIEIIPSIVHVPPKTRDNLREQLGIRQDAFVFGYHQRNCSGLFSPIPFDAFRLFQNDSIFLMLGGGQAHRDYVAREKIRNVIFLDHTSDTVEIHKFLQTLDCYTHAKPFGEVCSACMIEAMYHGLPIVSHPSDIDQGHIEMLDGCGKIANSLDEYIAEMKELKEVDYYYDHRSELTLNKYYSAYDIQKIEQRILSLYV